jgi:TrmH family RNA methyltransferase
MRPISKAKLKTFTSLQAKKYRYQHGLFLVEGKKMLAESLSSGWSIHAVVLETGFLEHNESAAEGLPSDRSFVADARTFKQLSTQAHPEGVLTILELPSADLPPTRLPAGQGLLLERIQDPGNLGTLIRTADWYGLPEIICSPGTVDAFNPRVLRSSMGSIFRVKVSYAKEWEALLQEGAKRVWLADMAGQAAEAAPMDAQSWILLGNEAQGISERSRALSGLRRLTLPRHGGAESLNVAVAGGILCHLLKKSASRLNE